MPFRDEPNNFDRLPHPSSLVLMAEYYNTTFGTDLPTNLGNPTSPTDFFYPTPHFGKRFTTSYCDPYYAFGQSNILWSDGHVSTVTWEDGQLTSRNVDPTVP